MTTITIPEKLGEVAGFAFDLTLTWIDTYGCRWTWTGETDTVGMPLMQTGDDSPERLSQVYWTYGPLIAAPRPVTGADRRAALTAPTCTAGDEKDEKETPTPRAFAALLGRLRGRSA
ncbi:phiSA1p31-related protein [Streptomyces sp. NPDC102451]|uniref:phiSA1p31-related protein n=1 Tax=Streptomyces sp. NPDC102451 TaxID=3366177 RepID=UPI0037F58989